MGLILTLDSSTVQYWSVKLSNELSRTGVLAFLPIVVLQGRRVRRRVERLPEATGTSGRVGRGGDLLRVVVVGDSVAAGVGVREHRHSMAGRLADLLHLRSGRPVAWEVLARSGADAGGVAALVAGSQVVAGADVVAVSVGVNDVKNLRSDGSWRTGLRDLLAEIVRAAPGARVFLLGLPPVDRLPALPRPLADLLGARGRRLDRIGGLVAAEFPEVTRLEFTEDELAAVHEPFASDGFHPGAALHDVFAREISARLTTSDLMKRPELKNPGLKSPGLTRRTVR
jgi:lysophospholipase L1-like esterase